MHKIEQERKRKYEGERKHQNTIFKTKNWSMRETERSLVVVTVQQTRKNRNVNIGKKRQIIEKSSQRVSVREKDCFDSTLIEPSFSQFCKKEG